LLEGDGKGRILTQVRSSEPLVDEVSAKLSSEVKPASDNDTDRLSSAPASCARKTIIFFSWSKIGINNTTEIQSTGKLDAPSGFLSSSSAGAGKFGGGGGGGLPDSAVASVWRRGEGACLRDDDDLLPESRPRAGSFPPEPPEPVASMALLACKEEPWVDRPSELEVEVEDDDEPLSETPARLELRKIALPVMMATATHKVIPTILAFVDGG